MPQLTDSQVEKILKVLQESALTAYKIAKDTGISQATIGNYRSGKTIPNIANALILKQYFNIDFADKKKESSENEGSIVLGKNNSTGNIDNRKYYSNNPGVLQAQIKMLEERILHLEAQLVEKDSQINKLLDIMKKN